MFAHIDGGAAVDVEPPDLIRWRQKEESGLAMADIRLQGLISRRVL